MKSSDLIILIVIGVLLLFFFWRWLEHLELA